MALLLSTEIWSSASGQKIELCLGKCSLERCTQQLGCFQVILLISASCTIMRNGTKGKIALYHVLCTYLTQSVFTSSLPHCLTLFIITS